MNDIFISYAHMDDQVLDEEQKGWITKFHRVLKIKLGQLLGEPAKIWRDEKLTGSDIYDDKIVDEFKNAKVMISVLSPRYIKSDWCNKELNEFYQAALGDSGIQIGSKSRLIKVVKTPFDAVEAEKHLPKIFESMLGFDFFEHDPESGRVLEFDETFGPKAKQNYYARIYDLASEIADVLKQIEGVSSAPVPESSSEMRKIVYLSAVTSDLQLGREKLMRELMDRGHRVLPDKPLPSSKNELFEEIGRMLAMSDCSVHLVGQKYGMIPEDIECSMAKLQNDLASKRIMGDQDFKRYIWMPRPLITDDDRQLEFITELKEDSNAHLGAEVIEDSLDNFRNHLVQKLKPKPQQSILQTSSAAASIKDGPPNIYLIFDQKDDESVAELEDYLFDQGFEVMVPVFDAEEDEIKKADIEKMVHCDAVLIYYAHAKKSWVDMTLMDLMKAPGYGRSKPYLAKTVYLAPPMDRRKQRYRTHSADVVIQEHEAFEASLLRSFVDKLKR